MDDDSVWASDVPISMPQALPHPTIERVPMFGFCFTEFGLFHDLTQEDVERIGRPSFAPLLDPTDPVVYDDGHRQ